MFLDPCDGLGFDRDITVTRIVGTGDDSLGFAAFKETLLGEPNKQSSFHVVSEASTVLDKGKRVCGNSTASGRRTVSSSPKRRGRPAGSVNKKSAGILISEATPEIAGASKKRSSVVMEDDNTYGKKVRTAAMDVDISETSVSSLLAEAASEQPRPSP